MKDTNTTHEEHDSGYYGSGSFPLQALKSNMAKYVFASQFVKDKVVLEIGCGTGVGASYLKRKGSKKIFAGDVSIEAIEYASNHYQQDGLTFILMDGHKLDFRDGTFDLVIALEVIEHLSDYKEFLRECSRVLTDGGIFVCSTPNKETCSPNSDKPLYPSHVREFYPQEFRNLLAEHFKHLELYGFYPISGKIRLWLERIKWGQKPKIYYRLKPLMLKMLNPLARYLSHGMHHSTMQDVNESDLERMVLDDKNYHPFPMVDCSLSKTIA